MTAHPDGLLEIHSSSRMSNISNRSSMLEVKDDESRFIELNVEEPVIQL